MINKVVNVYTKYECSILFWLKYINFLILFKSIPSVDKIIESPIKILNIDSILPCPKGCSSSSGVFDILRPTTTRRLVIQSALELIPSAVIDTRLNINPIIILPSARNRFTKKENTLALNIAFFCLILSCKFLITRTPSSSSKPCFLKKLNNFK